LEKVGGEVIWAIVNVTKGVFAGSCIREIDLDKAVEFIAFGSFGAV
jgi:hypothetical protein